MRLNFTFSLLLAVSIFIISCGKDDVTSTTPPTDSAINNNFVRLQVGPKNDTVYHFTYDSNKRLKTIEDTAGATIITATYSSAGNISSILVAYGATNTHNFTYTYNADNHLTQIDYLAGGVTPTIIAIAYTNGLPSKKTQTATYNGVAKLYKTWLYTVKDSNITNIKEYDADSNFVFETVCTFTDKENILKPLGLFGSVYWLDLSQAASLEAFYNKNLIATSTIYDVALTNYVYTYNDNKQLTKLVASTEYPFYAGIWTRTFSY